MKNALIGGTMFLILIAGIGCGGKAKSPALKPMAFYNPSPATAPVVAVPPAEHPPLPPVPPDLGAFPPAAADKVAVASPPEPGALPDLPVPATRPSPQPRPGASNGIYMIVGVVIGQANGHAIYADKVLARIDAALYARATDKAQPIDPQAYRAFASSLIDREVQREVFDELEFAAAQRNNTDEEQQMAAGMTTAWRMREISKAGGSLAIARKNALEESNMDFDELVTDQYLHWMVIIFYEKHVWPRVQISADDMRRFYDQKRDDLFTDKPAALFRLIRIGTVETGGRDAALAKANAIAGKARNGEDFADLARSMNDDKTWARNNGYVEMVEKDLPVNPEARPGDPDYGQMVKRKEGKWYPAGSLAMKEVEAALLAAQKGAILGPIEAGPAFYVAKLEDKTVGRVKSFEDQAVQREVLRRLTEEQRAELRRKELLKLMDASVSWVDPEARDTALEMAMQKYAMWRAAANLHP